MLAPCVREVGVLAAAAASVSATATGTDRALAGKMCTSSVL